MSFDAPFTGDILIVSFNFAPKNWALCNGQLLAIAQNQTLFSLIGTTYGGDGLTTFGLPSLQGRVPMHVGNGHVRGEKGGETTHAVSVAEMPQHVHTMQASSAAADSAVPTGRLLGNVSGLYGPATPVTTLRPEAVSNAGGAQPHSNMQPYLVLNFIICLSGITPS